MDLHHACGGEWDTLVVECRILFGEKPKVPETINIFPLTSENTRIKKVAQNGRPSYHMFQDSAIATPFGMPKLYDFNNDARSLLDGDHSIELWEVCVAMWKVKDLEAFRESQEASVTDLLARVETFIRFIGSYRDPARIRPEWEAMVGIADLDELSRLKHVIEYSTVTIHNYYHGAVEGVNDRNGPFEKRLSETLNFTSVHAVAVYASIVFEAADLPKNIIIANRLNANNNSKQPCHLVDPSKPKHFKSTTHIVRFLTTAIHERFGHGTGKFLGELKQESTTSTIKTPRSVLTLN
ncbi:hypothetical protein B7494_g6099 [Chlorociboria aeruginascens]|nr:hypothetical protein B7494_g6099 [Chlorociboria aeruginascens]